MSNATRIERTDCHCPSRLVPDDYEYVAQEVTKIEGLGDCIYIQEQRAIIRAHMARTGGTYSRHEHGGTCGVCGSVNAIYTVLFYHARTNSYVRTGQECAELIDRAAGMGLTRLRAIVKDAREAQAGIKKAKALLADAGLSAAWDIYAVAGEVKREEGIIRDIVGRIVKWGNMSDAQRGFMGNLMRAIAERPAREAARLAEAEAAAPCPTGKVRIVGVVLSVREESSGFGYRPKTVFKMLVKADEGFKVWGSIPSGATWGKGDRVDFTATVTPKDGDPKFGFFKRPTMNG